MKAITTLSPFSNKDAETPTKREKFGNFQLVISPFRTLFALIFFENFDGNVCTPWCHHVIATGGHFETGKQTITRQNLVNLEQLSQLVQKGN